MRPHASTVARRPSRRRRPGSRTSTGTASTSQPVAPSARQPGVEVRLAPAGDDDARAEAAERARDRQADPGAAAGHERGLPVEDARREHNQQVYCEMVRSRAWSRLRDVALGRRRMCGADRWPRRARPASKSSPAPRRARRRRMRPAVPPHGAHRAQSFARRARSAAGPREHRARPCVPPRSSRRRTCSPRGIPKS